MQQLDKVFLGNTPGVLRSYLFYMLKKLKDKNPSLKVNVPCCGSFAMVKCALSAGFTPMEIEASDVSIYSSILGYVYSGRPIDDLPFQILREDDQEKYKTLSSEEEKGSFLNWLMKLEQINPNSDYNRNYIEYYEKSWKEQVRHQAKQLEEMKKTYGGLTYRISDMRAEINKADHENTVLVINPPAYKLGYTKMFTTKDRIKFTVDIPEFFWDDEFADEFEKSLDKKSLFLWYVYKPVLWLPVENVFFAAEYMRNNVDYWVTNRPETLIQSGIEKKAVNYPQKDLQGLKVKQVPKDYEITEATKVTFKKVSAEQSLYYRDLWAHRLGNTRAEEYGSCFWTAWCLGQSGFILLICGGSTQTSCSRCSDLMLRWSDTLQPTACSCAVSPLRNSRGRSPKAK